MDVHSKNNARCVMNRTEKRDKVRNWYKQISKMSLAQFEKFLQLISQDTADEVEAAYIEALKKEFGFGAKRIERLKDIAQEFYYQISEGDIDVKKMD